MKNHTEANTNSGGVVIHRSSSSIRTKAILGSLSVTALACALAQAPQSEVSVPAVPRVPPVPLVSGACPAVARGGTIAFDWNPDFDPSWAGTGMRSFRLIFQQLREDGVTLNPASRLVLVNGSRGSMTDIGNGFFHLEARLSPLVHPGTYHLVGAVSSPQLFPDYRGEAPKVTVSPVSEFYCITVVRGPESPSLPSSLPDSNTVP